MGRDNRLIKLFQNLREIPKTRHQKQFLTVTLGDHQYGLEIRLVTEIVSINKLLKEPDISTYIKGMLNWHGSSIPVLDIQSKYGPPSRQYDQNACIAVMNLEGEYIGLVVDQTNKITALEEKQFVSTPPT